MIKYCKSCGAELPTTKRSEYCNRKCYSDLFLKLKGNKVKLEKQKSDELYRQNPSIVKIPETNVCKDTRVQGRLLFEKKITQKIAGAVSRFGGAVHQVKVDIHRIDGRIKKQSVRTFCLNDLELVINGQNEQMRQVYNVTVLNSRRDMLKAWKVIEKYLKEMK